MMLSALPHSTDLADAPVWIDLYNADAGEIEKAERLIGLRVPTREALSEIESSSRIFIENGALYLSMPLISSADDGRTSLLPLGFVLTDTALLTVRFGAARAIDAVAAALHDETAIKADDVFAGILEAMVDRAADRLEHAGADLDEVSRATFSVDRVARRNLAKASDRLRNTLKRIGQTGDGLSQIRDTLLGLDRICGFVAETPHSYLSVDVLHRLKAVQGDVKSLNGYEEHLANKVQFLLDATLGFINIEQNDIVKVLTVVSVVGVPPVLVAGIYGMNFKGMPELSWSWGYPYSLVLMVVSAVIPLMWFKWRGWM
jgi:magnesium transporter